MAPLTWRRDGRGRQVSTDGNYAVVADGYERGQHVGAQGDWRRGDPGSYEGFVGGEWAAVHDPDGRDDNLDWFPTMREAKAECQRHADRTKEAT